MGRRPRAVGVHYSQDEMLRVIQEGLSRQAKRPNLFGYKPHPKQELFHRATTHSKLYIGGNRAGKTTCGVVEDIFWLIGRHPYRKVPEPPTRLRVVAVDFIKGVDQIVLPEFKRWIPPSFLKSGSWDASYQKEGHLLTLANGSTCEFMSGDQDLDKFSGTSRHAIHYDEEPPEYIYKECQARLIDTDGSSWLTMTPVEGMSWVYDTLYLPGIGKPSKFAGPVGAVGDDITVIVVDMLENPYITPEAAERYLGTLTGDERNAREHGTFVQLGGLVFKEFATAIHVIKGNFVPPFDWEWYVSIDHGYNNPTAMLWHAVSPDDRVITFSEHYASEMTVKEHAAVYHARNVALGKLPDFTVGDPAMAQRNGVTGTSIFQEYADAGVFVVPAGAKDVATGVNRMAQYLKLRIDGKPSWQITDNCDALINEIQRLRWKTWASRKNQFENNPHENIHKKNDHACDSSRYFFTFLPDLTPEVFKPVREDLAPLGNNRGADTAGSWDEVLAARSQQFKDISQTNWTTYEGNDLIALEYD